MSALPAYSLLLRLIALLGYTAIAAGVKPLPNTAGTRAAATRSCRCVRAAVPVVVRGHRVRRDRHRRAVPPRSCRSPRRTCSPQHLQGILPARRHPRTRGERLEITSLVVKVGAVACMVFLDPQFHRPAAHRWRHHLADVAAVALGIYTRWFHRGGLIAGWVAGMGLGTWMLYRCPTRAGREHFGGSAFPLEKFGFDTPKTIYVGLVAVVVNLLVAALVARCGPARCPTVATTPSRTTTSPRGRPAGGRAIPLSRAPEEDESADRQTA